MAEERFTTLRRARPWLLLLLAVALGPHCWCFKHEVLVELDGPIAVKWDFKREPSGGGRGVGIAETNTLRFEKPQALAFEVFCKDPKPKLMAAPSGLELAYQCAPETDWKVIYLSLSAPRAFEHCDLSLGTGREPSWDKLPDFQQASAELLGCLNREKGHQQQPLAPLIDEVRARGGDEGLTDLLIRSRAVPFWPLWDKPGVPAKSYDLWEEALLELPPKHRDEVVAALQRDLESKGSDPVALERALWVVEAIAPRLLVARARELNTRGSIRPLHRFLARLARIPHDEAGPLACAALPQVNRALPGEARVQHAALAVIALRQAPCPRITEYVTRNCEAKDFDCSSDAGSQLCTSEELQTEMAEVLRIVATERRRNATDGGAWFRALLAASYAQGDLPEPVRAAAASRQELRRQCRAFTAWWKQMQDDIRAEPRRERAKAYRVESRKPLQFEDERLRGIEKRMKALFSEVATAEDEAAAASDRDAKPGGVKPSKRVLDLVMQLDKIASEQRSLCTGL